MLSFSKANKKLREIAKKMRIAFSHVFSFDLPAGYSCPKSSICACYANKDTGNITMGKNASILCYAAKAERQYTNCRKLRWNNYNQLIVIRHDVDAMVKLILSSIPQNAQVIRIHSSGDFFTKEYFIAWCEVAKIRTDIQFFAYTKILAYANYSTDNFSTIYSYGGKDDEEFDNSDNNTPVCKIRVEKNQYPDMITACETDNSEDFYLIKARKSFVLNLH